MKKIALLGSTGSIGKQVLAVVDRNPDKYKIVALAANSQAQLLGEQINKYQPSVAALSDPTYADKISSLPNKTRLFVGENALMHAVMSEADIVFVAVVGFCGLEAVIAALNMGKSVALANKESLVCGGKIVTELAKNKKIELIPVDSEHSAIWQALNFKLDAPFEKLMITASGGAFRDKTAEELKSVLAADALKHPNWNMGSKITVDCATMVNKGFEVIEAMWLYNAPLSKIEVLVHPESIVHSMVETADGAIMAQMGMPTMEVPISLALSYPNRLYTPASGFSLVGKSLHFEPLDIKKYPCFKVVMDSIKMGDNYPCALSGANEEAVALFLADKIPYLDIRKYLELALEKTERLEPTLDNLKYTDLAVREIVRAKYKGELN